jgi:hypothetical protein
MNPTATISPGFALPQISSDDLDRVGSGLSGHDSALAVGGKMTEVQLEVLGAHRCLPVTGKDRADAEVGSVRRSAAGEQLGEFAKGLVGVPVYECMNGLTCRHESHDASSLSDRQRRGGATSDLVERIGSMDEHDPQPNTNKCSHQGLGPNGHKVGTTPKQGPPTGVITFTRNKNLGSESAMSGKLENRGSEHALLRSSSLNDACSNSSRSHVRPASSLTGFESVTVANSPPTNPPLSDTLCEGLESILERVVQHEMSQGFAAPQDALAAGAHSPLLMANPVSVPDPMGSLITLSLTPELRGRRSAPRAEARAAGPMSRGTLHEPFSTSKELDMRNGQRSWSHLGMRSVLVMDSDLAMQCNAYGSEKCFVTGTR